MRTISGIRKLDTTAEPCEGCFGSSLGAPTSGRDVDMKTPNSWQWNTTFQHEVWHNATLELGYVANYGYNLLRTYVGNPILSGDTDHDGVDDRLQYVTTTPANAALRQFGIFGNNSMRTLLGDWEVTAIVGAGTGQPLTVFTGSLPGLNGGPSGTGYTDNQRPNRVSSEPCRATGGLPEQIINPDAYTLNGFQLGALGTARRGDCTGPGYFQTDLAFYKNIPLGTGVKLQFRWDIFNLFNNANFLFQDLLFTMNPSEVTLNAADTQIANATIPASFGQATRVRDPRQMQLGLKLLW